MCQPANLTSNLSAGIELAPYLTHVHQHMFPMELRNVTARYHTFGGVVWKAGQPCSIFELSPMVLCHIEPLLVGSATADPRNHDGFIQYVDSASYRQCERGSGREGMTKACSEDTYYICNLTI